MPHAYYQIGGSLPYTANSYVKRAADDELYKALKQGKFCYVLTARQLGKSSLRVRTMRQLQGEGYLCIYLDMTQVGSRNISPEQWYNALMVNISEDAGLIDQFDAWEIKRQGRSLSPISQFSAFFKQCLLPQLEKKLVIFIDEIDAILSLDRDVFNTDDFFAVIRSFYNERADNYLFEKVNFALFGVAHPNDLMKDVSRTPFNIGEAIMLHNFQIEEARKALISGLEDIPQESDLVLKEIFRHTQGQPYLTQKLCATIAENPIDALSESQLVYKFVHKLFLNEENDIVDPNLSNINNRLLNNKKYNLRMLQLYQRILKGEKIATDPSDFTQIYLKLSGLVVEKSRRLVINNKIYRHYFDQDWLRLSLDKIDRPYAKAVQFWLEKGKADPATALRGAYLQEALDWKKGREDLSPAEQEFFEFSQLVEVVEGVKVTRAEYAAKLNRKIRAQRNILILMNIFALLFVIFLTLSLSQFGKIKGLQGETDILKAQNDELLQLKDALEIEQNLLQKKLDSLQMRTKNLSIGVTVSTDSIMKISEQLEESKKELRDLEARKASIYEEINNGRLDVEKLQSSSQKLRATIREQEDILAALQESFNQASRESDNIEQDILDVYSQIGQKEGYVVDLLQKEGQMELIDERNVQFLLDDQKIIIDKPKEILINLKLKKQSEILPDLWLALEKQEGETYRKIFDRILPVDHNLEINQKIDLSRTNLALRSGNYHLKIVFYYSEKIIELKKHKFQIE